MIIMEAIQRSGGEPPASCRGESPRWICGA